MALMRPKNEVESTLAAAFTRGSSTTIDLDDASNFPDSGVVRIDDGNEWCLLKYGGKSGNSLTDLSDAEAVNVSSGGATYTWPVGTTVTLVQASDYLNDVIDVLEEGLNGLSDVTISSPADNDLLAYDSGSGKWINQTPGEAGLLASDGSVPLVGDLDFNFHSALNLKSAMGILNVKGFGAKGDGTTDDTAAFQAAIAAAADAGGGIVYIPPGNYPISSTLTISADNIHILGAGKASYIKNIGTGPLFSFEGTDGGPYINFVSLRGVFLGQRSVNAPALQILSCQRHPYFEDIFITGDTSAGSDQHGILMAESWTATFRNVTILAMGGNGITLDATLRTGSVNDITFVNVTCNNNGGDGIYIKGGKNNVFIGCDFESNSGYGANVAGDNNTFLSSWFENHLYSNGDYNNFIGCNFASHNITIAGNYNRVISCWNIGKLIVESTASRTLVESSKYSSLVNDSPTLCLINSVAGSTRGLTFLQDPTTGEWNFLRVIDTASNILAQFGYQQSGSGSHRFALVRGAHGVWLRGTEAAIFDGFQTSPGDSVIPAGGFAIYLDEANNRIVFRTKYSDGTLKTGYVSLA